MIEIVEHEGIRYAEIIRAGTQVAETTFFSPPANSFQFGIVARPRGFTIQPHSHEPRLRAIHDLQEALWVQAGSIAVDFFTPEKQLVKTVTVHAGDAILLVHGAHGLRFLEDARCIAVKQGPFFGDDKVKTLA